MPTYDCLGPLGNNLYGEGTTPETSRKEYIGPTTHVIAAVNLARDFLVLLSTWQSNHAQDATMQGGRNVISNCSSKMNSARLLRNYLNRIENKLLRFALNVRIYMHIGASSMHRVVRTIVLNMHIYTHKTHTNATRSI
jgi:hypothetical protein